MRKYSSLLATLIVVIVSMPLAAASLREISKYLGLHKTVVPVVGTGSMYPSLFWEKSEGGPDDNQKMSVEEYRTTPHMYHRFPGFKLGNQTFLKRPIGFGDLVAFQSAKTSEILAKENKDTSAGFIKRVIGLPGDTIELRDGYVLRNGQKIDEPYIYKPRSTYGDSFLPDCQKLTIPTHSYFVLGDNRKASSDSRGDLGLVSESDITFVLPYQEQSIYHSLWRDTSRDEQLSGRPTLISEEFYTLVNNSRTTQKIAKLTPHSLLTRSASIRGNAYLANKNLDLKSSLSAAGYRNIVTAEFITPGHYTAEELLQNLLYFGDTAKQILDPQYQEIGVAAVTQEIDGCPTQVIVGHLGGYLPASYEAKTIQSWSNLRQNLEKVLPGWEQAVGEEQIDQAKLQELLSVLRRRLALARETENTMKASQWLTDEQQARIKADEADSSRAESLARELNGE